MKLTAKERREMEAMVRVVQAKLDAMPEQPKGHEERRLIDRLCDVRNGLRAVLTMV